MANTKPVSFRLPSKYVVFLDHLANEKNSDRTAVLIKLIDLHLQIYLAASEKKRSTEV